MFNVFMFIVVASILVAGFGAVLLGCGFAIAALIDHFRLK